jgi:bifunctional non-homologous end joining protein LigD
VSESGPRGWIAPMLATLVEPRALPDGWIYEPKLDGVRGVASRQGEDVRIYSRNKLRVEGNYPEVAARLRQAMPDGAIVDGELIATDPATGVPSFSRLQQRMKRANPLPVLVRDVPVEYSVFDCLALAGKRITRLPWTERRALLEQSVEDLGAVRLTPVLDGGFDDLFAAMVDAGFEGLMGKRAASSYRSGRSRDWVKLKPVQQGEFVIIGWTEPKGSRAGLGALLLGVKEDSALRYTGKVGTGFTDAMLRELQQRLAPLERQRPPVAGLRVPASEKAHWVTPRLRASVGFSEWTNDGMLRHPRLLGVEE